MSLATYEYLNSIDGPDSPHPDLNRDSAVDTLDLIGLLDGWGGCPPKPIACPADLNFDQVVDVEDLLSLLRAWD